MKTQQLLSTSIICVITLVMPFGARYDARADRAREAGRDGLANKLERKGGRIDRRLDNRGDRINARLDRKGNRIDRRLDNKGDRINARLNRRRDHRQATRNARRALGRRGARQSGYAMRGGDNRRVSGKRRR